MVDDAEALNRLAASVPANVRTVCKTLVDAGFEAVTVGGAVRDALLGRMPGDWDVATAALPADVMRLFPRTVPTGIEHGTVTIVTGKGIDSHVEVTTYRAEVGYTDSRRPDQVVFGVPLVDDLARRDLRANAIAYDPINDRLIDPYNGRADLAERVLRAVGASGDVYKDAVGRFSEDGLRVMRAVRFAAQLEMSLDPDTERGIEPALPSLAKVSKERISIELAKLLAAREPSRGLASAERTGIVALVLPDLASGFDRWANATSLRGGPAVGRDRVIARWLARVDAAPRAVRLAALLVELGDPDTQAERQDLEVLERTESLLKALKFSNADARTAAQLASIARAAQVELTASQIRRLFAAIGRDLAPHAVSLWRADATASLAAIAEGERILRDKEPLSARDLALTGKQLMDALSLAPGPVIGRLLEAMLDRVLVDPALNTRDALVDLAKHLRLELGSD